MTEIALRELRNNTSEVLRRVENGEELDVTVNGRPVARIVPLPRRRRSLSWQEMALALADTSLFVALEHDRPLRAEPPAAFVVSIITVGELRSGVLNATNTATRALRLRSLVKALESEPLPVDDAVVNAWAELRARLRKSGRRLAVNDSWIAATAIAHGLALVTQDRDYTNVPGLAVLAL